MDCPLCWQHKRVNTCLFLSGLYVRLHVWERERETSALCCVHHRPVNVSCFCLLVGLGVFSTDDWTFSHLLLSVSEVRTIERKAKAFFYLLGGMLRPWWLLPGTLVLLCYYTKRVCVEMSRPWCWGRLKLIAIVCGGILTSSGHVV